MKSYRKTFLTTLFASAFFITTAQENTATLCSNGIDDDGDGLVDCYDAECAPLGTCDDFFFGNSVVCLDDPDVTDFTIALEWGSADQTATSHASPAIGDLDQNGIPEVITVNNYGSTVTVLNGSNGQTIATRSVGFNPENTPAIANVFDDETTEILVSQNEGKRIKLFEGDLSGEVWSYTSARNDMGIAGFADFNEDGVPEVYYKNEILNAQTGALIIAGDGDWERDYVHGPIAVDILAADDADCLAAGADCSGLELITGNEIWAIDIGAGTRTVVRDMNQDLADLGITDDYYVKYWGSWLDGTRSCVSVADFDLDGNMDILMSGAYGSSNTDETTIFFWDVEGRQVTTYHDPGNNFKRGPGRINIGDVDGDGELEANFVMDQFLYSLNAPDFSINFKRGIDEGSSGFTGCTLFDFDGDGTIETVYRSEQYLYIIDGTTGDERTSIPCVSRTQEEYPVVADVDGDGASEICVACYTNDATPFAPYSNTQYSQIRIYGASGGESWMPARDVFNQHGYFNVNINDDLTVPTEMQDHVLVFSNGVCENADGTPVVGDVRPLNTFLTQAPILDENGCVEFVSPDMAILGNAITATDAQCPDGEIEVTFTITNEGDTDVSGGLPVSYYAIDSLNEEYSYLDTETVTLINFEVGTALEIVQTINGIGGEYDLYVVVNDLGGDPSILGDFDALPSAVIPECETANNYNFTSIGFEPFHVSIQKLEDDRRCYTGPSMVDPTTDSIPPNGSARAFYFGPTPGDSEGIYFENFEDLTNGDQMDAGETGWTSTPDGAYADGPSFYGITDYQGSKMFRASRTGTQNDVGLVTWTSEAIDISDHTNITATVDLFEQGNNEPLSNKWRDYVNMSYEIYDEDEVLIDSGPFTISPNNDDDFTYVQSQLTGIRPNEDDADSLLVIIATIHNTCSCESHYIDNINVTGTGPDIVKEFDEADGFSFYWFNPGDYTDTLSQSSIFSGMAAGTYEVIAEFPGTECISDTVDIEILNLDDMTDPAYLVYPWVYVVDSLTNCSLNNGSLTAFAYTSTSDGTFPQSETNPALDTLKTADGYVFNWRITSDFTNTYIGTGDTLRNLGNTEYTVDIFENFSGCDASAKLLVPSKLEFPLPPDVEVTNIMDCGGTGTLSASVGGNTADYDFEWYDGDGLKPDPDSTDPIYVVSNPGEYTVRAIEKTSSCPSSTTLAIMVDEADAPTPTASETAQNTTCNTDGNGSLTADGDGAGTVTGYDFTWYYGSNALASFELPGTSLPGASIGAAGDHVLEGLVGGTYTLVVQDLGNLCRDTISVDVTDNIVNPVFNVTSVDAGDAIEFTDKAYVTLPQLVAGLDAVTISFWAELSPSNYASDHIIFSSGGTSESQLAIWADGTDGITFVVKAENDGGSGKAISNFEPTGWTNIAATWDFATSEMKLFIDGVLAGSSTYVGTVDGIIDAGTEMFIARDGNLGVDKFEGRVDDFRIYDYAVDENTIIATICDPASGASNPLVYFDFNDLTDTTIGATIPDVGSNGNDGTVDKPGASPGSISYAASDIDCPIANAINNSSCDAGNPNGSIDVSGDVFPLGANYQYTLYSGYGTSSQEDQNSTGIFSSLLDGFYTVVVEDLDTNCETSELYLTIASTPDDPSITTDITVDTHCTIGSGDGEIEVTSSSTGAEPGNYLYEIFDGHSFSSEITSISNVVVNNGATGTVFSGLEDGNYRIRVTNNDILCSSYTDVVVGDNSTIPAFSTSQLVNDNTSCATPNGFISVSIDGDSESNYEFTWYLGDHTSTTIHDGPTVGLNSISNLAASKYTVVAEHTTTGCQTVTLTKEVFDLEYVPNIIIEEVASQTDCGTGNGSLRAYVDNDPDGVCTQCDESNGFTFKWYLGDDTSDPLDGSDANGSASVDFETNTVSGIISDEYTVEVTYTDLGCSATGSFFLTDSQVFPIISLNNAQPNTGCNTTSYDGEIHLDLSFDGSPVANPSSSGFDFDYYYSDGSPVNDGAVVSGSNTEDLSGIINDTYKVVATSSLGCTSDTLEVVVNHEPNRPDFESSSSGGTIDNTVCDPTLATGAGSDYNGQVQVDIVTGTIGDYTIEWYDGTDTSGAADFTGNPYTNLQGGTYSAVITNTAGNDCDTTIQVIIIDDVSANIEDDTPVLTPGPDTSCNDDNGSLTIDVAAITDGSGDYLVNYYNGTSVKATADGTSTITSPATSTTINDLPPGEYTIDVVDINTGCTSLPVSDEILDQPDRPDFESSSSGGTIDNTVCDPTLATGAGSDYNGQVQVDIVTGTIGDYTIEWYDGTDTSGAADFTGNPYTNLQGGTYSAVITNTAGNDCDTTIQVIIIDDVSANIEDDTPVLTPGPDTSCNDDNGSLTIDVAAITDGSGDYLVNYYNGTSVKATADGTSTITSPATSTTINDLPPGEYTIDVVDINTGCTSLPVSDEILDQPDRPDFESSSSGGTIDNTVCDPTLATGAGSDYNGQVQVDIVTGTIGDYTIEWYDGTDTSGAADFTGNPYTNLQGGTYSAVITNTAGNDCDTTIQVIIIDDVSANIEDDTPVLTPGPDTSCNDDNGSLTIDVAAITDGSGDYLVNYYNGTSVKATADGTSTITSPATSTTINDLPPGEYTIDVVDINTGCTSLPVSDEILDQPDRPDFESSSSGGTIDNTVCDPTLATGAGSDYNGQVQVDIVTGTIGDYTIEWYDGTDTSGAADFTGNPYTNLQGGTYSAVITNTAGNDCDTTIQVIIIDDVSANIEDDTPVLTPGPDTSCNDDNGSLTIDVAAITDGSGDYLVNYYNGTSVKATADGTSTITSPATSTTINDLPPGEYTIDVVDINTGCTSLPVSDEILDQPDRPDFESSSSGGTIDNTVCDPTLATGAGSDYNGQVQVDIVTGTIGDYTIEWYDGTDTSGAADFTGNPYTNLQGGTYSAVITNTAGNDCDTTIQVIIIDDVSANIEDDTPVLTPGPDTSCNDDNGSLTIDVAAITDGSGDYLVNYYNGTSVKATADGTSTITSPATSTTINDLPPGEYTIDVVDINTGCTSLPVSDEILDQPDRPDFESSSSGGTIDNTVCDPTLATGAGSDYNGQVQVDIVTGTIGDYTIEWYDGTDTSGAADFTGNPYTNLQGGTYSAVITNTAGNDCDTTIQVIIIDDVSANIEDDTPVLTPGPDTSCNDDNGSLTIDVAAITDGSGDYLVNYYNGTSVKATADGTSTITSPATSTTINDLPPGEYTIDVVDINTGCTSLPVSDEIEDTPTSFTPDITLSGNQTSCDLDSPNGQLIAFISNGGTAGSTTITDYSFEWFEGQNTDAANAIPATKVPGAVLSNNDTQVDNLPAGIYTVLVTHTTSGCSYTAEETIATDTEDPTFSVGPTASPSNSCSSPNGSITFTVDAGVDSNGDIFDGVAGYTVEIFEGASIVPSSTSFNSVSADDGVSASFTGLAEGIYSIRATDDNTSCTVVSENISVGYNGESLTYDIDNIFKDPLGACFDNDGILDFVDAVSAENSITGNVVINWYIGTDTSSTANLVSNAVSGATFSDQVFDPGGANVTIENARMENLPAISYTGVVEYANGCKELFNTDLSLTDAPTLSIINTSDPTRCATDYDGSFDIQLTANGTNSPNDFNYFVFDGVQTIEPDADDPPAAPYFPDLDEYSPLLVSGNFTSSTTNDTEVITIDEAVVTGGLDAGDYTIAIEVDDADRCITNVITITLNEPAEAEIELNNKSNNTICDVSGALTYDGSITVDAVNPASGFDFIWYYDADGDGDFTDGADGQTLIDANGADEAGVGSNVTGFEAINATTSTIGGLGAGWYRVIATHNAGGGGTACEDTLDIQLFDEQLLLEFDVAAITDNDDILDCSGGTNDEGTFVFSTIDEGGLALGAATADGNFTITWDHDADQNGVFETTGFAYDNDQNDATNLAEGDWRLNIESLNTGCTTSYEFTIDDTSVNPTIALDSRTADAYCDGTNFEGDGTLTVTFDEPGQTYSEANFSIEWYRGTHTVSPTTASADFIGNEIGTGAGGNAGTATLVGGDVTQLSGLEADTYTVFITKDAGGSPNLNCTAFATFTIDNNQPTLTLDQNDAAQLTTSDNENCNTPNGTITVLGVEVDGVVQTFAANTGVYSISWTSSGPTFTQNSSADATNDLLSDLGSGTYTATITNTNTGCATATIDIIIDDDTTDPTINLSSRTADAYCDGTNFEGDGTLTVTFDEPGFTYSESDFSIEWYRGTHTTNPGTADADFLGDDEGTALPGTSNAGTATLVSGDVTQLSGLEADTYTVFMIKDNVADPNEGCEAFATFTIDNNQPTLTLDQDDAAQLTTSDNENCNTPNGTITVLGVEVDGVVQTFAANTGVYSISWTSSGPTFTQNSSADATNDLLSDLGSGTYTATITNTNTGCATATIDIIIDDDTTDPTINLSSRTADAYCDGTNFEGDGTLTVTFDEPGFTYSESDFSIEWYRGTHTTNPGTADADFLGDDEGTALPGTSNAGTATLVGGDVTQLSGLEADTYTAFMIKDNVADPNEGCEAFATFTIDNNQPTLTLDQDDAAQLTTSDNENCNTPNGTITVLGVEVDGVVQTFAANTGVYSISWTSSGPTFTQNSSANATNDLLSDLGSGTYTATITNTNTGCTSATIDIIIDDDTTDPTISLSSRTEDAFCDGTNFEGDGTLTVTFDEPGFTYSESDFSIEWYRGTHTTNPGTADADFLGDDEGTALPGTSNAGTATLVGGDVTQLSGLEADTYTVFMIKDNVADPNEGCEAFATFTIDNNQPTLTLDQDDAAQLTTSDNENCNTPNGTITVLGVEVDGVVQTFAANTGVYSISWTSSGPTFTQNSSADATNDLLSDLGSGTYTATITDTNTGCATATVDIVIDDDTTNPTIALSSSTADAYCDGTNFEGDGTLTVTFDEPGFTYSESDFSIEWYRGTHTTNPGTADADFLGDDEGTALPGTSNAGTATLVGGSVTQLSGLEADTYTVFMIKDNVADPNEGCEAFATFTIDNNQPTLTLDQDDAAQLTTSDNENCNTPNGTITVLGVEVDGVVQTFAANTGVYSISWTSSGPTFTQNSSADATNDLLSDLGSGTYTATITDTNTGCATATVDIVIDDDTTNPTIALSSSTADAYCDGTNFEGDGTLTVTFDEPGFTYSESDFSIEWYRGTHTTNPGTADADFLGDDEGTALPGTSNAGTATLVGGDVTQLSGLEADTYTVFMIKDNVADPNEGCEAFATFTIDNNQPTLTLDQDDAAQLTTSDNENCNTPNGTITVLGVEVDGVVQTFAANTGVYSISWTSSGPTFTQNNSADATNDLLSDLGSGTYTATITNTNTGCATATVDIIIDDNTTNPTIELSTSSPDTYCDGTNFVGVGSMTVTFDEPGFTYSESDFSIEWYRGTHSTNPGTADADFLGDDEGTALPGTSNAGTATLVGGDVTQLSGLEADTYTVFMIKDNVADPNEGCEAFATFTIDNNQDIPVLDIDAIIARMAPDTVCAPPGTASGTIIIQDDDLPGVLDDYEIIIRQGSVSAAALFTFTNNGSPEIELNTLTGNDYFISAQNTTTGCSAATGFVNVPDSIRNPQISLVSITPNNDCGGGVQIGGIEAIVDNQFTGAEAHIDVQWHTGTTATAPIAGANTTTLSDLSEGDYTIEVTNNLTSCSVTATYNVPNEPTYPSISNYDVSDVTFCFDNGSFALKELVFDNTVIDTASITVADYQLEVYSDPGLAIGDLVTDGDGNANNFVYGALGTGTYYAAVRKVDSDCLSEAVEFDINDNVFFPDVQIAMTVADSTCASTVVTVTPNGTLVATGDGEDDTNTDYTFEWFSGSGVGSSMGITTSTISGLAEGTYTVRITYTPSGCSNTGEFVVPNVSTDVDILTIDATSPTTCVPANGIIEVTSVSRNSITDYTFEYYDTDPTVGTPAPVFTGNAGASFTTAEPDATYYVIGINTIVGCETLPFEVFVGSNLTYPEIELDAFEFQTNCDESNPNGSLTIIADGVTPANPDYDVVWYFQDDLTNTLDDADIGGYGTLTGETTATVSGIPAGLYTVGVTNNNTGCSSTFEVTMADDIPNPVAISTSSSANTNCVNPNGQLGAGVVDPPGDKTNGGYNFYWYLGDQTGTDPLGSAPLDPFPVPDYRGTLVTGVDAGTYTLFVVDTLDTFCRSVVQLVQVEDGTSDPDFTLTTTNVTTCFEVKDGYAEVEFGDFSLVDPEWIDDTNTVISTEIFVRELDAGSYILRLTNRVTGCVFNEVFTIENDAEIPSDPLVILNRNRTNCQEPNGSAVANVDGDQTDYLFEWFDQDDMSVPYATGAEVFNLDSTTYLVRATRLSTGCVSAFSSVTVDYIITDPSFSVEYSIATCLRTEDGAFNQFNGTAIIGFDEFNAVQSYEWYNEFGELVGDDVRLIDAPPGDYTVVFVAENGCQYSESFSLTTNLTIYNGISANADGLNDFFLVDCADYFPNNNVMIFNRDGVKVYETDGYDNITNRFEGISNVGGSGLDLPSGTYFYIIDKGDGSDLIQGFLELAR